ncbi:MAG: U32 family peptidase [Clostridia bacterium]|nr:U32 family peptidase [Clostridia bacterium]
MKITAGFGCADDYDRLCDAGADELFCGYVPVTWLAEYGNILPLNRREVLFVDMQLSAPSELRRLRQRMDVRGVPVALTFNSLYYTPAQYSRLLELLADCVELGFDRFIIADPVLALHIKRAGLRCHIYMSGECGEINRYTLPLYADWGVERLIFHRQVTLRDMASLTRRAPDLEYEAFILNERCRFTGAFCQSLHCDELAHICRLQCEGGGDSPNPDDFGASGCGICALGELRDAGVTWLKVVGRGAHIEQIERDVRVLRGLLDRFEAGENPRTLVKECSNNCYYRM